MITRPLLAETLEDLGSIEFPILVSRKLDGIRILKVNGEIKTRNFKPLPNRWVRAELEKILPNGIDGEIMIRDSQNFQEVQSSFMSFEGQPDFVYYAFDYVISDLNTPYEERISYLKKWYAEASTDVSRIKLVLPVLVNSVEELLTFEDQCLNEGYEGVMIRNPQGKYKCGRSTLKEGILLKLKRFEDSEAIILGFEEKEKNTNPKEKNELGLSKRSTKKAGMVGADTLGKFNVKDIHTNLEFDIGTGDGLNDALRKEIWEKRSEYLGKILKYKYQKVGSKELESGLSKPRFPVFIGFRDLADLDLEVANSLKEKYPDVR